MNYNAAQIIGKTLIAAAPVALKRLPLDSAPGLYTVPRGVSVGVVDTYLLAGPDRSNLYWSFKDQYGRPYYAKHETGLFSLSALKDQGAQSTIEVTEAKKKEEQEQAARDLSIIDWIKLNGMKVAGLIAVVVIGKEILPGLLKSKK